MRELQRFFSRVFCATTALRRPPSCPALPRRPNCCVFADNGRAQRKSVVQKLSQSCLLHLQARPSVLFPRRQASGEMRTRATPSLLFFLTSILIAVYTCVFVSMLFIFCMFFPLILVFFSLLC